MNETYADLALIFAGVPGTDPGVGPEAIHTAETHLGVRIPEPLRAYYKQLGGHDKLNNTHNRFLRLEDLEVEDERLVFLHENQSACWWGVATDGADPDPIVEQKQPEDPNWYSEEIRLSGFLRMMIYLHCSWGACEYTAPAGVATALQMDRLSGWQTVVKHHELTILRRDKALLCAFGDVSEASAAAADKETFEALLAPLGFELNS